jgi:hypothetical protein
MRFRPEGCDLVKLGDFRWEIRGSKRTLEVLIPAPSTAGRVHSRWTISHKNHCGAQWKWDGNEEKPTLRPSLHAVGIWHGHVRKGELVEA